MRSGFIAVWLLAMDTSGQTMRYWQHTYDEGGEANGIGSAVVEDDTTYRIAGLTFFTNPGLLRWMAISKDGDTVATRLLSDPNGIFQGGGGHSVEQRADGTLWFAGGIIPFNGDEPDGRLVCFGQDGDTCWTRRYGTVWNEALNAISLTDDGGALLAGLRQTTQSDVYAVRVDANGDTLWTRTYGGGNTTENAFCVRNTLDGGFIIGGFKVLPGNNYDMYVLKLDSNGNQQWQRNYGSPWIDNAGFVEALPQGGYIMAGAERTSAVQERFPTLYKLDVDGFEVWSRVYEDTTLSVFFSVPLLMSDGGYAISGGAWDNDNHIGLLMRVDSVGEPLWHRTFKTNDVHNSYFYDLRRTLDGGFIMAGTAWDSLLVSQDAWLVKTDSFGCLVPGCQVFDGVLEQYTDLTGALTLSPNPTSDLLQVGIVLPPGLIGTLDILLTLVDAQGRRVQEERVSGTQPSPSLTLSLGSYPGGIYFLHLTDGARWFAGSKVILE